MFCDWTTNSKEVFIQLFDKDHDLYNPHMITLHKIPIANILKSPQVT